MHATSLASGIRTVHSADADLDPWSIPSDDIISGQPDARGMFLWQTDDKRIGSGVWTCTPGTFRADYAWDETAQILEGRVTITDDDGDIVTLGPGDLFFVPIGSKTTWVVHEAVRKSFHLRANDPVEL